MAAIRNDADHRSEIGCPASVADNAPVIVWTLSRRTVRAEQQGSTDDAAVLYESGT
jgi:hypothetical protein